MKRIQKRMLMQIVMGFLIGRANLFGMCIFGVAYFAAGFEEKGSRLVLGLAVILGMISSMTVENAACGAMVIVTLWLAADLFDKRNIKLQMGHAAIISAVAFGALTIVRINILPYSEYSLWLAVFGCILIIACTRIFYDGIYYMLHARRGQNLDNEEMISIIIIGALCIWGLPQIALADVSLIDLVTYFVIITMGYCYGTGTGAVTGAAAGVVMALYGSPTEIIGVLSLLGICAGMLREQGKLWMLSAFTISAVALNYMLAGEMMDIGTLKAIGIDCGVFLCLPEKYVLRISIRGGDRAAERKSAQKILEHRLNGFSDAFGKLSRTLTSKTDEKFRMNHHEMRKMMEDMSMNICERCEKREGCMGQLSLYKPEMFQTLIAGESQGSIILSQMPGEFIRECIHPERFLSEANQNLYVTRNIMEFKNRMAESRKVVAGQMKEVGDIMRSLVTSMPRIQQLSVEVEDRLVSSLHRHRIDADEIIAYEKQDGRLEISMQAKTAKGRLVTSKEVARILSDVLGKNMCPSEESRKVLISEYKEFMFHEDTALHALTGVARMTKNGEEISGDTFSCISLPGGEMLLALSDGMGSGNEAFEESQTVIDLLEEMAEAGFSQDSAIKLINSLYLSDGEMERYATVDVVILNLYKQNCCFLKNGAAATYLKHNDKVYVVEGQDLPVGVMHDIESYVGKVKISQGDYVIMMTDGVSDVFDREGRDIEKYLQESILINPQEIAEHLLDEAIKRCGGYVDDDMSVIVAGIIPGRS